MQISMKITYYTKKQGNIKLILKDNFKCQYWDYRDLKIICQRFKAALIKILFLRRIKNTLETNEEKGSLKKSFNKES